SFITDIIERHQFALQVFGSVVLAAFGLYLFRKNPTRSLKAAQVDSRSYWSDFISGFFLTFSNPLILFFIIGLFARFNFILPEFEIFHYIWAYLTIFGGALLWWYFVTFLVSKLRSRFNVRSLWLVNRIVGSILIAMAVIGVLLAVNEHVWN
ncbi:MAG: LysE family transporter, partial [Muribaculaceae bacterium]|nr:LysE family transporter [Muribaculaceae bacterium]